MDEMVKIGAVIVAFCCAFLLPCNPHMDDDADGNWGWLVKGPLISFA
jgi:hypothetical protein